MFNYLPYCVIIEKGNFPLIKIEAFREIFIIRLLKSGYVFNRKQVFKDLSMGIWFDKHIIENVSTGSHMWFKLAGSVFYFRVLYYVDKVYHYIFKWLSIELVNCHLMMTCLLLMSWWIEAHTRLMCWGSSFCWMNLVK